MNMKTTVFKIIKNSQIFFFFSSMIYYVMLIRFRVIEQTRVIINTNLYVSLLLVTILFSILTTTTTTTLVEEPLPTTLGRELHHQRKQTSQIDNSGIRCYLPFPLAVDLSQYVSYQTSWIRVSALQPTLEL